MITINGAKFAYKKKEFLANDCQGYYKAHLKMVVLMDENKKRIGVINANGTLCKAVKLGGRWFYEYGVIDLIGKMSYDRELLECSAIANKLLSPIGGTR